MSKEQNTSSNKIANIVAVVAVIGLVFMAIAYFKKDSDTITKNNVPINQKVNNLAPTPTPTANQLKKIKITKNDHIRGNFDAPITIVEYSDFQCPYCQRFHGTLTKALSEYPNKVRWVYKYFPLTSIHRYAQKSAEAAECASDQGKFWDYADGLFANQRNFSNSYFSTLAKNIGLDVAKFDQCLSDGKYTQRVKNDYAEGQQRNITGTPGSFINGQKINGAIPYEQLKAMIDNLLK